jgi:hypothetical protein
LRASRLAALADGVSYFTSLPQSDANATPFVANDDKRTEIETPTTFDNFGGAVNKNDLLNQVLLLAIALVLIRAWTVSAAPEPASRTALATAMFSSWPFASGAFSRTLLSCGALRGVLYFVCFIHNIFSGLIDTLKLQTRFPRGLGQCLDLTVIRRTTAVKHHLFDALTERGLCRQGSNNLSACGICR